MLSIFVEFIMKKILLLSTFISSVAVHASANGINGVADFDQLLKEVGESLAIESGEIIAQELQPPLEEFYPESHFNRPSLDANIEAIEDMEILNDDFMMEERDDVVAMEIDLYAKNMREGRIEAIDRASLQAAQEMAAKFSLSVDVNFQDIINNSIQRVLILDEGFDKATNKYFGFIEVWADLEDVKKYALGYSGNDEIVATFGDLTPDWVLVVPSKINEHGYWEIDEKTSEWNKEWRIPVTTETTQFIGARPDFEDVEYSKSVSSISEFTVYLMNKYNADNIMYAAIGQNNQLNAIYWSYENQNFYTHSTTIENIDNNYKDAKSSIVELFWELFIADNAVETAGTVQEEAANDLQAVYEYRLVGSPVMSDNGAMINLQVIHGDKTKEEFEEFVQSNDAFDIITSKPFSGYTLYRMNVLYDENHSNLEHFLSNYGIIKYRR